MLGCFQFTTSVKPLKPRAKIHRFFQKLGLKTASIALGDTNFSLAFTSNLGNRSYSNLGNVYFDLRRFDDAIRVHRQATQLNPNYAPAYNNLGNALREKGELSEAVLVLK